LRRLADPTWALGPFKSLCGTVAFSKEPDMSPENAVANRSATSWRWSQQGAARPHEWREVMLGGPPRQVAPSLAALTFCGRRTTSGWICLAFGALTLTGWLRLDAIQRLKLRGKVMTA